MDKIEVSMPDRKLVLIGGGTGSGKTTLARRLSQELNATLLAIDDYYHDRQDLTLEARTQINYDEPNTIEIALLGQQMRQLLAGDPVKKPIYDFSRHTRSCAYEWVEPKEIIILEGIFALCWPDLNEISGCRIFVHTPEDLRFKRRISRDIFERGRDEMEVTNRFRDHVSPMHHAWVEPSRDYSTITVHGNEHVEVGVQQVLETVISSSLVTVY